jgi:hypothetical protein
MTFHVVWGTARENGTVHLTSPVVCAVQSLGILVSTEILSVGCYNSHGEGIVLIDFLDFRVRLLLDNAPFWAVTSKTP